MDDASLLFGTLQDIQREGLVSFTWSNTWNHDTDWGMFRLTYMPMVYVIYKVGALFGPTVMFLWNAFLVFGILYLSAYSLERVLRIPRFELLLVMAGFPYAYDLLQHPSLQEKLLLLFGMPLLAVPHLNISFWKKFSAFLVLTLLGMATKSSFCIFLAVGFLSWLEYARTLDKKEAYLSTIIVVIVNLATVTGLVYLAKNGLYTTNHFNLEKIPGNLQSKIGLLLAGLTLLHLLLFLRKKNIFERPTQLIPAIAFLSYLAIFLPWNLSGYLLSILTPFWAALILQVARKFFPEKLRLAWLLPLMLLAVVIGAYRPISMFGRLGDIRNIVYETSEEIDFLAMPLHVPCMEGSDALGVYLQKHLNHPNFETEHLKPGETPKDFLAFFDRSMCPLPIYSSLKQRCQESFLYKAQVPGGYNVVRFTCN